MRKLMKQKMSENILNLTSLFIMAAFLTACAQGGGDAPSVSMNVAPPFRPGTPPTVPTVPGSSGIGTNTVPLVATAGALGGMFFNSSGVSNPTNIQLSMSVSNSGAGYAGTTSISFSDNSGMHVAQLSTTHPSYGSTKNAEYNVWLNATQWHGFFQDLYGAIIVVIDHTTATGDGSIGSLGGKVYYQNFGTSGVQGPLRMCWQINPTGGASTTPYDCRSFLTSFADGAMPVTTSSLYPNNAGQGRPAYALLGSFEGLSQAAALGN